MYRGFPIGDWKGGGPVAKNYYFSETGDSGREIVDRANRKNRRWKNVKFCSWIELKEREKQRERDRDGDKINEKKKGKKMEKIFSLLCPREI